MTTVEQFKGRERVTLGQTIKNTTNFLVVRNEDAKIMSEHRKWSAAERSAKRLTIRRGYDLTIFSVEGL